MTWKELIYIKHLEPLLHVLIQAQETIVILICTRGHLRVADSSYARVAHPGGKDPLHASFSPGCFHPLLGLGTFPLTWRSKEGDLRGSAHLTWMLVSVGRQWGFLDSLQGPSHGRMDKERSEDATWGLKLPDWHVERTHERPLRRLTEITFREVVLWRD